MTKRGKVMKQVYDFLERRKEEFEENYSKYGDDTKSLNMRIINQYAGFISLLQYQPIAHKSILDIGCGLGDLNHYLALEGIKDYNYLGVDIVPTFIEQAKHKYGTEKIKFQIGNFIDDTYTQPFSYIVGNKIFYRKIKEIDTLTYVKEVMGKAYNLCDEAIMFNFLSDYAEIQYEANFYVKPEQILSLGYSLSKNIVLRNDYSPFEFTIIIFKDNDIHTRPTYFYRFAEENREVLKSIYGELEDELATRER